jgi:xanthine/CO dehydrogenase XdhC/CoxF family maturation factor
MSFHGLTPLFERARERGESLVLATVIRTGGSTYAKPGALMLIANDGEYAGLLSGGCLEGDLREHAREVAATGTARIVSYDLRSTTDQLFGLGAGCEGAMDILLTRHGPEDDWRPLPLMANGFHAGRTSRVAFVTSAGVSGIPLGLSFDVEDGPDIGANIEKPPPQLRRAAATAKPNTLMRVPSPEVELFIALIAPAPRVLLLGGGPDAQPVTRLAQFLGWHVTVIDHRAAYLAAGRFPPATQLIEARAEELAAVVPLADYAAAIVMSHHLVSDLNYLRALAASSVPYVGLLGPAMRREKLLADLGADAVLLRKRLRAPVGLDIGGRSPESIALSIVGEVHAALAGRAGRPFSETVT